jgi:hypothetical protein
MAPKRGKGELHDGILVCGPDGQLYFIDQGKPQKAPELIKMSKECMTAFAKFRTCLKTQGEFKSDLLQVVLSGVMTRADGITRSKRVGQRSAKKRR